MTCADIMKQSITVINYYYMSLMHQKSVSQPEDDKSQSISHNVTESLVIKCILTCISLLLLAQALKYYFILFT